MRKKIDNFLFLWGGGGKIPPAPLPNQLSNYLIKKLQTKIFGKNIGPFLMTGNVTELS